jgi:cyclophilin family peptidyl-prolyl cis-trans isomerase
VGCGTKTAVTETPKTQDNAQQTSNSAVQPAANPANPAERDVLHQSFADATRDPNAPAPDGESQPPDMTMTNKPTAQLLKEVQQAWDGIRFLDQDRKRINYTAVVDTTQGTFEIELKQELAPNHVRNFIALARVGYYDALLVDRIHHEVEQVSTGGPNLKLDMIEAGCPVGSGEAASGSIGYWLRPEFSDRMKHEEGTVGFCRGSEADTACTRFYVTLDQAPVLDGNYSVIGKVKSGLDVVRKIARQPVIVEETEQSASHRPEKPIMIKKVTIRVDGGVQS